MLFALKKIVAAFLLPPGLFCLLLALLGVWLWRRRQRGPGFCALLLAVVLWGLSTGPVVHGLLASLEQGQTVPANPRGDVIVLLGGGIFGRVADLTGTGSPGPEMYPRLVTAVRLQRRLQVPILVSGGVVFAGRPAEAPIIRRFLTDLGVPAGKILLEEQSRDTVDNARFCREILHRHGFRHPLLVTSAYHLPRALRAFQACGVPVTAVPANFLAGPRQPLIWADLLPSPGVFQASTIALREYLGLLFYKLTL